VIVGAAVGLIHGIYVTIFAITLILPLIKPILLAESARRFGSRGVDFLNMIWNMTITFVIIGEPIFGVAIGAVIGYLFAVFVKRIPGKSLIQKSLFISLVLMGFSASTILIDYFRPRPQWSMPVGVLGLSFLVIFEYPLIGCLFGFLLQRKLKATKF